ncbi:MAG: hypothetical protein K2X82_11810 [Gemmataceae bacterium]|nr:hypothetical protein [Gemmataceae bacterium]
MSVLDLLTCALGGTILTSFLLIVSIEKSAPAGFPYAYFAVGGGVWVDVTDAVGGNFAADALTDPRPAPAVVEFLAREYEAELELYFRPEGTAAAVPKDSPPLLIVSTARTAAERLGNQGAKVNYRVERLAPRWLRVSREVGGKAERRLFAAFRMDVAGFEVPNGWYFVRAVIVKRPTKGGVGWGTAAWLRIDSGGEPGAARYQTHAEFPDDPPDWPAPQGFTDIRREIAVPDSWKDRRIDPSDAKAAEAARVRLQRMRWPDLYVPTWPADYGPPSPAGAKAQFRLRADDRWGPYFALRCERASGPRGAARFPTFEPTGDGIRPAGWYPPDPPDPAADDYLPGFRIGRERKK